MDYIILITTRVYSGIWGLFMSHRSQRSRNGKSGECPQPSFLINSDSWKLTPLRGIVTNAPTSTQKIHNEFTSKSKLAGFIRISLSIGVKGAPLSTIPARNTLDAAAVESDASVFRIMESQQKFEWKLWRLCVCVTCFRARTSTITHSPQTSNNRVAAFRSRLRCSYLQGLRRLHSSSVTMQCRMWCVQCSLAER